MATKKPTNKDKEIQALLANLSNMLSKDGKKAYGLGTGMSGLTGLMSSFGDMLGSTQNNKGPEFVSGEAVPNNTDKPIDMTGKKNIIEQNTSKSVVKNMDSGNVAGIVGTVADLTSNLDQFENPSISQQKNGGGMSGQQTGGVIGQTLGSTIGSIFGMGELGGSVGKMLGGGVGGMIDPEAGTTRFEQTGTKPHYGMGTSNLKYYGMGTGEVTALQGDAHSDPSGGIDMNGGKVQDGEVKVKKPDGSDIVFSTYLSKDGKKSMADEAKKIENMYKNRDPKDSMAMAAKMQRMKVLDEEQQAIQKALGVEVGKVFALGTGMSGLGNSLLNNVGNLAYLLKEGQDYDKVDYGTIKPTHIQDNVSDPVIASAFNNSREALRNSGNLSGSRYRANLSALANTEATARARVKTDIANTNVGFDNQFGVINQQNKMQGMMDEAANKGQMKSNYWSAITKMAENNAGAVKDAKADKSQQDMLDLLKILYPEGLEKIK